MEPTSWIVVSKADGTIFGSQFMRPPDSDVNLELFDVKPWFDVPATIGDNDPTIDNATWLAAFAAWQAGKSRRAELRQFVRDNPQAKALIDLPAAQLLTAIETRNAGGETLLLKTLAMVARYLIAEETE